MVATTNYYLLQCYATQLRSSYLETCPHFTLHPLRVRDHGAEGGWRKKEGRSKKNSPGAQLRQLCAPACVCTALTTKHVLALFYFLFCPSCAGSLKLDLDTDTTRRRYLGGSLSAGTFVLSLRSVVAASCLSSLTGIQQHLAHCRSAAGREGEGGTSKGAKVVYVEAVMGLIRQDGHGMGKRWQGRRICPGPRPTYSSCQARKAAASQAGGHARYNTGKLPQGPGTRHHALRSKCQSAH